MVGCAASDPAETNSSRHPNTFGDSRRNQGRRKGWEVTASAGWERKKGEQESRNSGLDETQIEVRSNGGQAT